MSNLKVRSLSLATPPCLIMYLAREITPSIGLIRAEAHPQSILYSAEGMGRILRQDLFRPLGVYYLKGGGKNTIRRGAFSV